ncbi:hypothetical protein GCM10028784_24880 [Myceligenerans cantabricum]
MDGLGQVMRVVRTSLLASTSLSLAAMAHSLGGGDLPGTGAMAALGILTVAASGVAAQARPRAWILVPFLGALQLFLHQALSWSAAASAAAGPGTVPSPGHAGHHAAAVVTASGMVAAPSDHLMNPRMLALHTGAILTTALLMTAGERTAQAALQVFRHVLPALAAPRHVPARPRPRSHPRPATLPAPLSVLVVRSTPRRGPPAALTASA